MKKFTIIILLIFLTISISILYALSSKYEIQITRKAQNLYKVSGSDLWIETKYCYEYSYSETVIMDYSGYGYTKGELIFKNGRKCDISEIYESRNVNRGTKALTSGGEFVDIEYLLTPTRLR